VVKGRSWRRRWVARDEKWIWIRMMKGRRDREWRARMSVARMRTWVQTMEGKKGREWHTSGEVDME
jgi:hypothetical protein